MTKDKSIEKMARDFVDKGYGYWSDGEKMIASVDRQAAEVVKDELVELLSTHGHNERERGRQEILSELPKVSEKDGSFVITSEFVYKIMELATNKQKAD